MPAALDVDREPDWSGIRVASVTIGVREAARQASSHLSKEEQERFVERVMKRCSREGWMKHAENVRNSVRTRQSGIPMSAPVRTGADTVVQAIAEDGVAVKSAGMKYARTVMEHALQVAEQTPEVALAQAGDVKSVLQAAALAGDWQTETVDKSTHLSFFSVAMSQGDAQEPETPILDITPPDSLDDY